MWILHCESKKELTLNTNYWPIFFASLNFSYHNFVPIFFSLSLFVSSLIHSRRRHCRFVLPFVRLINWLTKRHFGEKTTSKSGSSNSSSIRHSIKFDLHSLWHFVFDEQIGGTAIVIVLKSGRLANQHGGRGFIAGTGRFGIECNERFVHSTGHRLSAKVCEFKVRHGSIGARRRRLCRSMCGQVFGFARKSWQAAELVAIVRRTAHHSSSAGNVCSAEHDHLHTEHGQSHEWRINQCFN